MTVNLCTRNYRLIIGGLDCSPGVVGLAFNQSQYASNSGLIVTTGQITLRHTLTFTPDLDDRVNAQWSRKTPVTYEVADTTGTLRPAPVGYQTYILEAEYDGRQSLTIRTACIIGLLDAAAPPGPGLDVEPGQVLTGEQIAGQISARLGGVAITGSIPAQWKTPTSKTDNRSYLKFLGALCWANGRIAYSNSEDITIKPVNVYPSPLLTRWVERDAQDYGRLTGAERPCEVVRVSGVALDTEPTPDDDETIATTPGVVSDIVPRTVGTSGGDETIIVSIVKTTNSRNKNFRTETQVIEVERAAAVIDPRLDVETSPISRLVKLEKAETTTSVRQFERKPYITGAGPIGAEPVDEGRLLEEKSTTVIKGDYALKAYNDNLPSQLQKFDDSTVTQEETVTTHTYRFLNREAGEYVISGNYVQYRKVTETRKIRAVAFPSVYFSPYNKPIPYEIQTGPNSFIRGTRWARSQDPLETIVTSRVIVEYAENAAGEWTETTTPYSAVVDEISTEAYYDEAGIGEIYYSSPPDPMPEWLRVVTLNHGNIRLAPGTITVRRGPQVQPPSPTRFSKETATKERQVTGEAKLPAIVGGSLQDRERDYQAEAGTLNTKAQANSVAKIEGAILLGRHKGTKFALDCADPFFNYTPLSAMDWVEPNGTIQRYLIDGLSLGMSDRQLVAAADGIWVGTVGTADPNNPPNPDPPPPDPESTTETPPPTLPYRPVYTFTAAMAHRGIMASLPFPTVRTFTFATISGHYFGGLSRAGDAPVAMVGSEAAADPIIRGVGDAPVATVGSESANAPPLPGGEAPVATLGTESANSPPPPNGDAPVATVGSESAGIPVSDGDAPTATIGSEGA